MFGPLQVGGKRETRLNQIVPGRSTVRAKRALAVGSTLSVVNVTSYCFHVCVRPVTRPVAYTVLPSSLSIAAVIGPVKPGVAFAKKDAR